MFVCNSVSTLFTTGYVEHGDTDRYDAFYEIILSDTDMLHSVAMVVHRYSEHVLSVSPAHLTCSLCRSHRALLAHTEMLSEAHVFVDFVLTTTYGDSLEFLQYKGGMNTSLNSFNFFRFQVIKR